MTTFVEMSLLWIVRIVIILAILFGFFNMVLEIPVFDHIADVVYEFGGPVPPIVLQHTTLGWRQEHSCQIGYQCKGVPAWER
jgi:hypothetical protein